MRERPAAETISLITIQRLQAAYGDAVTRRAWQDLRALFEPDATVELDLRSGEPIRLEGADAVVAFVSAAVDRFAFFEFALLNAVADLDGDVASGRVYICELRHDHDGEWSQAYGLYQDLYRRHGERWLIAERRYSSLARRHETVESFGLPETESWPGWPT